CGGGRYDDLTGIFGLPNMSGVGISFGADRIYDVLKGLDLFPQEMASASTVLFSNMGEDEVAFSVPVAALLRRAGIACEIYPDNTKLRKQFEYADKKGIPYLAIVGANEIAEHSVTLKNLTTGEQQLVKIPEIIDKLNQVLNV
ncbi:MAG TPA: His/Gly/Thr/Pro-type tRNA ligase C-terminal domain-containing protein, partial [Bacteroidales bacterium]|nr:His/Gly/Thr/Pro-type tRNA ligase C-terminal domain-containing protein [Bacteroidales bacterium]